MAPAQRPHGLGPHAVEIVDKDFSHAFVTIGENVYFAQPRPVDVENAETGLSILTHEGARSLADAINQRLRPQGGRDQPLTIEIDDGRLVVSIGADTLMTAVRGGDDWDDETMTIVDPNTFATEIAHALEHNEQEDGTTDIHLAIDKAAKYAIESGSEAVRFADDEIVYDRDGPR